MYDPGFTGFSDVASNKSYAVHWKAADTSDEMLTFHYLQSAHNYDEYKEALTFIQDDPGTKFCICR